MISDGAVKTELQGSLGIISLTGEISSSTEQAVLDSYQEVTNAGAAKILLRFADSCFINSAGIAFIIIVMGNAKQANQYVGAIGLSLHFQKIFEMIGLTEYLTIFQGEDLAQQML
jgi:anti-sigma B factor antagonist